MGSGAGGEGDVIGVDPDGCEVAEEKVELGAVDAPEAAWGSGVAGGVGLDAVVHGTPPFEVRRGRNMQRPMYPIKWSGVRTESAPGLSCICNTMSVNQTIHKTPILPILYDSFTSM